jgi:hypothetical protein
MNISIVMADDHSIFLTGLEAAHYFHIRGCGLGYAW